MNGSQPPEAQKPPPASPSGTNGHSNNSNSSLAAKKRKKDGLKPIITMEGASPQTPGVPKRLPKLRPKPEPKESNNTAAPSRTAVLHGAWLGITSQGKHLMDTKSLESCVRLGHPYTRSLGVIHMLDESVIGQSAAVVGDAVSSSPPGPGKVVEEVDSLGDW
ncbi:hypothetical protein EDB81DRAFT_765273 [Dactylonectria macrodidyma]|uniref:Uncharacterized protein n=1 Tax=Dactylonectria macrodidyma TaxID=307937 RepID=A0A9P9DVK0_9HYPO|nr:hypothetical protein EDB81DRAFT_765273 [Dactylonectria macrodidyma]